jgi:uncharacterized protein
MRRVMVMLCLCLGLHNVASAQAELPILDMHMHARLASHYGPPPQRICAPVAHMPYWDPATPLHSVLDAAPCENPLVSPLTDGEVLSQTIAMMERYNMHGVLGGAPDLVAIWMAAAPGRFIPGLDFRLDRATGTAAPGEDTTTFLPIGPDSLEQLFRSGAVAVFAEVLNQFGGIAPDDERMDPYWALAEAYDIPVGIHIGPGAPGEFYLGNRAYRARLQSALSLEEVLIRYPRLRVYIMHAGYPFLDDLIALMFAHPQVYVEVSMLANVEPREGFYRYLKGIVDAGYGKRVMFGSDQMIWPGLVEAAIHSIEEAPFLSVEQKRDIFYNNAARFLRLRPEEIARHHGS